MTEFNLSEKQKNMPIETEWKKYSEEDYEPIKWEYKPFYSEDDIKEFIKRLKEELGQGLWAYEGDKKIIKEIIDKLAGDKLNGNN